jgi:co-chaperonin GroES (HSP10)
MRAGPKTILVKRDNPTLARVTPAGLILTRDPKATEKETTEGAIVSIGGQVEDLELKPDMKILYVDRTLEKNGKIYNANVIEATGVYWIEAIFPDDIIGAFYE